MTKNHYKSSTHTLRVGLLPYIYNHNCFIGKEAVLSSKELERVFVFSFIISTLFKNKVLCDYKSKIVREKISSTLGISEKTYFRLIKSSCCYGFSTIEKNNLRFRSHKDIADGIVSEQNSKILLRPNHAVDIEVKNRNFDYVKYLIRFSYIKYLEHKKLMKIAKNISLSKKRFFARNRMKLSRFPKYSKIFVLTENEINRNKRDFISNAKAENFKYLYEYCYKKCKKAIPKDLGKDLVIKLAEKFGGKEIKYKLLKEDFQIGEETGGDMTMASILLEREKIRERKLERTIRKAILKDSNDNNEYINKKKERITEDTLIDEISRLRVSFDKSIKITDKGVETKEGVAETIKQVSVDSINQLDISGLNSEAIYASYEDLRKYLNGKILSPEAYFSLLSCDFSLEYRSSLNRISDLMGLSKGQISRNLDSMAKFGILKKNRRYVFLTTIKDVKNTKEFLISLKDEYSLIRGYLRQHSPTTNRLRLIKGCLLYEIEMDVEPSIKISFRASNLYEDIPTKSKFTKYKKIAQHVN